MRTDCESGLLLDPGLAADARRTAEAVVERLADSELVARAVASSERAATYPFGWGGASLFAGHAGSALVFSQASRVLPDAAASWRALAHEHLVRAVRSTHEMPLVEPGMAAGTAGLALALSDCADDEPRYGPTLRDLNAKLAAQVMEGPRHRSEDGVEDRSYDAIAGAAGILAHLVSVEHPEPPVLEAISVAVDDLIWLCRPRPYGQRQPWFIPPRHYPPLPEYLETFPHGYVNLGIAHGIPGPLAALSLAAAAGYRHDDLEETIRHVAGYLLGAAFEDEWGPNWHTGVPLGVSGGEERRRDLPVAHTTWCYGAPGVSCALLSAATALGDGELRAAAVEAFDAAMRRFAVHGRLGSATLCHGAAGLLAICARFARDTGSDLARTSLPALTRHVISHCDPRLPLGVQDLERPGVLLDSPGLLTGSAGVALALWSAATPVSPRWERALLIS